MPEYRLYRLDEAGHIKGVIGFDGPDDDAAIAEAIRVDHAANIEIWAGARKVALIDPERRKQLNG
jgi:hypothetical protein